MQNISPDFLDSRIFQVQILAGDSIAYDGKSVPCDRDTARIDSGSLPNAGNAAAVSGSLTTDAENRLANAWPQGTFVTSRGSRIDWPSTWGVVVAAFHR